MDSIDIKFEIQINKEEKGDGRNDRCYERLRK